LHPGKPQSPILTTGFVPVSADKAALLRETLFEGGPQDSEYPASV